MPVILAKVLADNFIWSAAYVGESMGVLGVVFACPLLPDAEGSLPSYNKVALPGCTCCFIFVWLFSISRCLPAEKLCWIHRHVHGVFKYCY